jgi:hypothetical protein
MRRLFLLAAATLVAISSCTFKDGASEEPSLAAPTSSDSSPSTVSPIPSSTFDVDYCAEESFVGDMFRSIRMGTRTDKEQIAIVGRLQSLVELSAQTAGLDEAPSLQKLAVELGRLEVSIRAAGSNYSVDPVVMLRARSASYLGLTAARTLGCQWVSGQAS